MVYSQQTFTQRLSALMTEKKVSKSQLADAIGCSRQTIGNYLLGKRLPDIFVAYEIACYFGVSCDYLIGTSSFREDKLRTITVRQLGLDEEATRFIGGLQLLARGVAGCPSSYEEQYLQSVSAAKSLELLNKLVGHDEFGVLLQQIKQYHDISLGEDVCSDLQRFAIQLTSPHTGKKYTSLDPITVAKEYILKSASKRFEEIVLDIVDREA